MLQIHIDWNALYQAYQLNTPDVVCYFNIHDGTVQKVEKQHKEATLLAQDIMNFIHIGGVSPRVQYEWVALFVASIENPHIREQVEFTINGKGAFRRFKDILLKIPEERRKWFEFRDQMVRKQINNWIAEQNISPTNPPPWNANGELCIQPALVKLHDAKISTQHIQTPSASQQHIDILRNFLMHWFHNQQIYGLSVEDIEKLSQDIITEFRIVA